MAVSQPVPSSSIFVSKILVRLESYIVQMETRNRPFILLSCSHFHPITIYIITHDRIMIAIANWSLLILNWSLLILQLHEVYVTRAPEETKVSLFVSTRLLASSLTSLSRQAGPPDPVQKGWAAHAMPASNQISESEEANCLCSHRQSRQPTMYCNHQRSRLEKLHSWLRLTEEGKYVTCDLA